MNLEFSSEALEIRDQGRRILAGKDSLKRVRAALDASLAPVPFMSSVMAAEALLMSARKSRRRQSSTSWRMSMSRST